MLKPPPWLSAADRRFVVGWSIQGLNRSQPLSRVGLCEFAPERVGFPRETGRHALVLN
jgi:hypothetical protein